VLVDDPSKLYTYGNSFFPNAEKSNVKFDNLDSETQYDQSESLLQKADGSIMNDRKQIGPLPFVVHLWRYMDYFDPNVPSLHDMTSGFWKPN